MNLDDTELALFLKSVVSLGAARAAETARAAECRCSLRCHVANARAGRRRAVWEVVKEVVALVSAVYGERASTNYCEIRGERQESVPYRGQESARFPKSRTPGYI